MRWECLQVGVGVFSCVCFGGLGVFGGGVPEGMRYQFEKTVVGSDEVVVDLAATGANKWVDGTTKSNTSGSFSVYLVELSVLNYGGYRGTKLSPQTIQKRCSP